MNDSLLKKIEIVELIKDSSPPKLVYRYDTSHYYDVYVRHDMNQWKIELTLKPFEKPIEKKSESKLFQDFIEQPRVFSAMLDGGHVGWIELGYDSWNNRMRLWEFLVKEEFRRRGIGKLLMDHAVRIAKEKGARMLVLETQTCDTPAINFYLKYGFELVGFDAAAYSNEDIAKKEVRLELGLRLQV